MVQQVKEDMGLDAQEVVAERELQWVALPAHLELVQDLDMDLVLVSNMIFLSSY